MNASMYVWCINGFYMILVIYVEVQETKNGTSFFFFFD